MPMTDEMEEWYWIGIVMDEILLERIELVRERLATLADDFDGPDKEYFSYIAGYIKKRGERSRPILNVFTTE